ICQILGTDDKCLSLSQLILLSNFLLFVRLASPLCFFQMIDGQIEKNLKHRIAYKEMPPEQKEELLQHRRQQYAARKHAISEKFH
ncbi:hypothetical protein HAX54_018964, partial [Datura stramonium]|nr:hypothetical protein [Datura stramonium]